WAVGTSAHWHTGRGPRSWGPVTRSASMSAAVLAGSRIRLAQVALVGRPCQKVTPD
ncbi:MAG: hypothetical protein AVDCRST_MAG88-1689, partial [uncultured Thermomicrobiales bacterium]